MTEVLGATEGAKILGVSRQRFYELRDVHPDFPQPVARLSRGDLWNRADLERWAKKWDRKSGRPARGTS